MRNLLPCIFILLLFSCSKDDDSLDIYGCWLRVGSETSDGTTEADKGYVFFHEDYFYEAIYFASKPIEEGPGSWGGGTYNIKDNIITLHSAGMIGIASREWHIDSYSKNRITIKEYHYIPAVSQDIILGPYTVFLKRSSLPTPEKTEPF